MAVISRFCNAQSDAEVLADAAVAGAADIAKAAARGYPANLSHMGLTKIREFSNTFSLSAVASGPAARAATSVGTSDTVKMFVIPANHVLLAARLEVVVPGTGTGTVALSDGTNVLAAATAVTSAAGTQASSVTPRFYATNTTVSVTVATAAVASGTYRVVVLTVDMTGQETTNLITG